MLRHQNSCFAHLLHVEILFVPYLMNHSALKEVAIKINAPASTQISVGFVFLEGFS